MNNDAFRAAMDKALYYLGFRSRTKKQMHDYLVRKEFDQDTIEQVMERLCEYGYVNDYEFAQQVARTQLQQNRKGKRAIQQKLWQSGVEKEEIEQVLETIDMDHEKEAALYWVERLRPKLESDPKGRDKMYRRLSGKGFCYESISYAMRYFDVEERGDDFDAP